MIYASKVRNTLSARDFLAILNKLSVRPRGSIGRYNQVIRAYSGWNRIEGYYTSRMAKNFAQAGGQYLFSNMRTFGARKLAIATGKKTLSVIIKKVPIVTAGFFLYYWYTGGFTYALGASFNDLTFPIGLAWQSKNFD